MNAQVSTACVNPVFPATGDHNCLAGAADWEGPGALYRGGVYVDGPNAGVFNVRADFPPSGFGPDVGFRAAR